METESKNSNTLAGKIVGRLQNEANDLTLNTLIGSIQEFANKELTNYALVKNINNKVKDIVFDGMEPDARSDDHPGVRYVVDFHGMIEDQFKESWQMFDN